MNHHLPKLTFVATIALSVILPICANANANSNSANRPIVSLDLCTDYLISWLKPTGPVVYSSRIDKQRPYWLKGKTIKTHSGSLEQLIKLNGRLYITGEFNNRQLKQRLTDLGHQVETTKLANNLSESIAQAQNLAGIINIRITVDGNLPTYPTVTTTAMLLGANGFVTGKNTFEHDLLTRAGYTNWATFNGYKQFSVEALATNMPPIVIESYSERPALANRIAAHSALKNQHHTKFLRSSYPLLWQCHGPWSTKLVNELRLWQTQN